MFSFLHKKPSSYFILKASLMKSNYLSSYLEIIPRFKNIYLQMIYEKDLSISTEETERLI